MKYELGDEVGVIDNISGHKFKIGDITTIDEIHESVDKRYYVCNGWYVIPDEIELVHKSVFKYGELVLASDIGVESADSFYYLGKSENGMYIVSASNPLGFDYFGSVCLFSNIYKKEIPEYTIEELKEKIGHDFRLKE